MTRAGMFVCRERRDPGYCGAVAGGYVLRFLPRDREYRGRQ